MGAQGRRRRPDRSSSPRPRGATPWRADPDPDPGCSAAGALLNRVVADSYVQALYDWLDRRPDEPRPWLRALATINFFSFITAAILVLYATATLHLPAAELGLVLGFGAAAGLVGSAVTGRLGRRIGVGPAFMLSCVLFPAPMVLVPLAAGPRPIVVGLLFAAEFGYGVGVMILDISIGSIFMVAVPDDLRARVAGAFRTVNYGVRPLGALTGGFLGSTLGLRPALWVGVGGGLLSVLWTLASPLPRLKSLDDAAPAQPASSIGDCGQRQPQDG